MTGYWGHKWATVKVFMRQRSRRQARRVVHFGARAKDDVQHINVLILHHQVTKGKTAIKKFTNRFKKFLDASFHILLDEEFQEDKALEILAKIEEILIHISQANVTDKEVKAFLRFMRQHLEQSTGAGKKLEQKNYRELLNEIAELENAGHEEFMTAIRNRMKTMDISQLARLPFYRDIRAEQQDIVILKRVLKTLKAIEAHIKARKMKQVAQEMAELKGIFSAHGGPIYDMFYRAYAIKHRDFVFTLMALTDEDFLEAIIDAAIVKNFYPKYVGKTQEERLRAVEHKFREDLNSIVQAERIFLKKESKIIRDAGKIAA